MTRPKHFSNQAYPKPGWQNVEGTRERRSPKGQGLLQKEGPPTYAILSQNLVLSQFTCFLKGFHRAFYESHPALGELSTKVSLLLQCFQKQVSLLSERFWRAPFQREMLDWTQKITLLWINCVFLVDELYILYGEKTMWQILPVEKTSLLGRCINFGQGGRGWLALVECSRIPQSFRRARNCTFSRQKHRFLLSSGDRQFVVVKGLL